MPNEEAVNSGVNGEKPDKKQILKNLIEEGRAKGMLSQKEIHDAFGEIQLTQDQFEKIVESLEGMQIEIVDKTFDEIPDEELLEEEEDNSEILKSNNLEEVLSNEGISVDDPVKIYLKEIGRVPLLSNGESQIIRS